MGVRTSSFEVWRSASQIEAFRQCPRKWAWSHIDRVEREEKPHLELGTQVHEQLENYLARSTPLDLTTDVGRIALAGLHLLPPPQTPGLEVEQWFGVRIDGHLFRGKKDWQILDRTPPLVGDHKTCKSLDWIKSEEELRTNFQACLYAADAMARTQARACDLHWVYYRTQTSPKARRVHLRVTREDVRPILDAATLTAADMLVIESTGLKALDLPPNPNACGDFGGCEFRKHCNLTLEEMLMPPANLDDFIAKIKNKNSAAAINPPAPPPEASAVPSAVADKLPGFVTAKRAKQETAPAPIAVDEISGGVFVPPTPPLVERFIGALVAAAKAFVEAMS